MGNTHSMNNMPMLDQKRYQAEFLRYSQIPYESQYHQQQSIHASNMNLHQFNKYKEQHQQASPVKVLPDMQFEPKLRTTNNGAILQSGGTISGRKDSDCGLSRSKSISETQNTYLSNPNGMPAPPPQYRMQRASTQLSINLHQPQLQVFKPNMNKNFGSSHDLNSHDMKNIERRQEKSREVKKGRAPPPPVTSQSNGRIKMTPPPQMQAPEPPMLKSKSKAPIGQRLFGDTLTKNHQNAVRSVQPLPDRIAPIKSKEFNKPAMSKVLPSPAKPAQMSKINPISYLRRERTFDMSLMQTENREKFKPKFSPQFQRKAFQEPSRPAEIRQMSTQERYRANIANRSSAAPTSAFQSELQSATKVRRSLALTSSEKMRTIDKKPLKKATPAPEKPAPKATVEHKKSDNSAISNPTVSASSSFKYSKPKQYDPKEPEIVQYHRHGEEILSPRESVPKDDQMNNFYFGMQEASVDTDNDDDNDADQAQIEAINRFAEDIYKMSCGGSNYNPHSQVSPESIISDRECDSDSSDILLNLRPTLPRRQLQIPRFSPVAAWKSLAAEAQLKDLKNSNMSASLLQLHMNDESRQETKIERIYREPSFSLQHLDNKSGDSGISADKEIGGNSPDSQMPQAYLMSSWTPQQDLEEDEESVSGNEKESYPQTDADKSQSFAMATNGHMFSLSLPRDNHSVSDKAPQNNFYSLQKFRKTVADVFGSMANVNDSKIQIQNYGVDSNWLFSSQPNSIDEFSPRKEGDRNQIISKMTSGKHVMYLPTNFEDDHKYESNVQLPTNDVDREMSPSSPSYKYYEEEEPIQVKTKSKSHKFKFQSTIRQVERRKIAEKLSREAEEKEMCRLGELEAMQKVEEEFQRKRAREKNLIRHQLRIASLEESSDSHNYYNGKSNGDDEVDNRTPYISRIIEAKSPRIITSQYKS